MSQKFIVGVSLIIFGFSFTSSHISNAAADAGQANNSKIQEILAKYPRLINLGSIEGKFLFMENNTLFNWFDAKSFCGNMSMTLVSINTRGQFEFLHSKRSILDDHVFYWTSGRDAQSWSQFVWDDDVNGTGTVYDYGTIPFYKVGYKTCVAFAVYGVASGRNAGIDCTREQPVICQAI